MQSNILVKTNQKWDMNNVLHKEKWNVGVLQLHMDPPPTSLIKIKHSDKSDKYFVNIKLLWDPTSENLDPYEFKIALFDNVYPEDFFAVRL